MIHAVVTGHSRGLGHALAAGLLARGARVLGLARHTQPGLLATYPEQHRQVAMDMADTAALAAWLAGPELQQWLAGADTVVLINNAGVVQPMGAPGRQGAQAIAQAVAVNVAAPLMLSDALVQASRGCADRRIAHISSGAGRNPYPGWSVYCATKAALDMHARAAVLDAVAGLRVASVAPGVIDTAMQADIRATPEADFPLRARFDALQREGQLADPADVAERLLDHLLSSAFGAEPVVDLRTL